MKKGIILEIWKRVERSKIRWSILNGEVGKISYHLGDHDFGWVTNYMVRSSLSPLLIPILQEFKLTYTQAGILATAFFYAYTFMQLPAGHLGDRLGRKVVLILCTSWWGWCLCSQDWPTLCLPFYLPFLTGVGEGPISAMTDPLSLPILQRKRGIRQGISLSG